MKILILGGTVFVGKALTDAARARGHAVTHLNRGKSAPGDARVETLHADRNDAAALRAALGERAWDAVIDTSGYMPQAVRLAAEMLRERAGHYLFVSSISAYGGFPEGGLDEDAPLAAIPDPLPESYDRALYGPLKAACEAALREVLGERATIVRPGLIVGPHDSTDRFTYWPVRIARGGEVLAPGRASRPVQFIDVRDLAEWSVGLLEAGTAGVFNATGPRHPVAMGTLLDACHAVLGGDVRFTWIDDAALLEAGVAPWIEMPLWIPESDAAMRGLMGTSIERAVAQGLTFRPLAATIADTLAWARSRPAGHAWKAGLTPERERALLEAARTGSAPSPAPAPRAG